MPSPETVRARELRRDMSGTERRVWSRLRKRSLSGHKFRRQVPIGPYFADFACLRARLVVEIDSDYHEDPERDRRKTEYLESNGFRVMRIFASDTDHGLDEVIEAIWWELHDRQPHPDPPDAAGREKLIPGSPGYFVPVPSPIAAWAAARRATGTRNGLHDT